MHFVQQAKDAVRCRFDCSLWSLWLGRSHQKELAMTIPGICCPLTDSGSKFSRGSGFDRKRLHGVQEFMKREQRRKERLLKRIDALKQDLTSASTRDSQVCKLFQFSDYL